MKSRLVVAGLILLPSVQVASAGGTAVSVVTGFPTGVGLEVTQQFAPSWNARVGGGIPVELEPSDVKVGHNKYDMTFKVGGVSALVDWHPTGGNFRLSAGALLVPERTTFNRTKAPFTLGNQTYTSSQVTRVYGETKVSQRVAPAFLVGWGNAAKRNGHWGFNAEAGIAATGDTKVSLTAVGPLANDPVLKTALEAERQHIKDKSTFNVQMIARIGVSYGF